MVQYILVTIGALHRPLSTHFLCYSRFVPTSELTHTALASDEILCVVICSLPQIDLDVASPIFLTMFAC